MNLKTTVLDTLNRNLTYIVDDLGIDGVDRRSVEGMWKKLSRARSSSVAAKGTLPKCVKKENLNRPCVVSDKPVAD